MKLSRLQEHLIKSHQDKVNKDITYFKLLKDKRKPITDMFLTTSKDELRASYNISVLIIPAVKEVI